MLNQQYVKQRHFCCSECTRVHKSPVKRWSWLWNIFHIGLTTKNLYQAFYFPIYNREWLSPFMVYSWHFVEIWRNLGANAFHLPLVMLWHYYFCMVTVIKWFTIFYLSVDRTTSQVILVILESQFYSHTIKMLVLENYVHVMLWLFCVLFLWSVLNLILKYAFKFEINMHTCKLKQAKNQTGFHV